MFGHNRAPKSDRHPAEGDFDYAMRLAAGFERPDWVVQSGTAAPVYTPKFATLIIALENNIPWEEAESVFRQSALGQVLTSGPEDPSVQSP